MTSDNFEDQWQRASHLSSAGDPADANHASAANHATPPTDDTAQPAQRAALDDAVRDQGDDPDARLLAMRERILADGALWRASLPPIAGLAAQVSALSAARRAQLQAQAPVQTGATLDDSRQAQHRGTSTASPHASNRREDRGMSDDSTVRPGTPTDAAPAAPARPPRIWSPLGAMRGALAGVAAVVVVALLAGVLLSLRSGHGGGATGANHATATTAHAATPTASAQGNWRALPRLGILANPPVIASSDPQVVYSVTMNGSLQRSADQGATWQPLPTPSVFPSQDTAMWEDIFVSPLNANTVYAMASLTNTSGGPINCPTPYNYAPANGQAIAGDAQSRYVRSGVGAAAHTQHGFASALSGVVPCETQVVSVDGGQHWRILTLPFAGRLGSANSNLRSAIIEQNYSVTPQAQGARLYSYADNGYLVGANGYRLATSADGGLTWQAADGTLTANGLLVCWYAATPTKSTVYAVAATSCDPFVESPQSFWRSDDAGANWRQLTLPAGIFTTNLALAATPTPTLYLMAPPRGAQPHTYNLNVTPNTIYTSADGGQTWRAAPIKGVKGKPAAQIDYSQTFVALPDATLVAPFADGSNSQTTLYYAWRPGAASWTPLPANMGAPIRLFLVNADPTPPKVWLLNSDLEPGNTSQVAYQVYTLTIAG